MKLSTAIRRFDTQMRADGKSPHTREVYLRDLRLLAKWLRRDINISTITPNRLARFLASRAFTHTAVGKHKAVVSVNRSKSALRSFFRFLTDSGYVKTNPARLIKSAPCTQKPPTVLTRAEVRRLLTTIAKHKTPIAKRDRLMFSLLLGTGIRLGSLVGLNAGDVDLRAGTLRTNGKRNVEQLVFLNRGLKRGLKTHVVGRNAEGPLFLSVSEASGHHTPLHRAHATPHVREPALREDRQPTIDPESPWQQNGTPPGPLARVVACHSDRGASRPDGLFHNCSSWLAWPRTQPAAQCRVESSGSTSWSAPPTRGLETAR
jgi:site-specific recombinase XerC